MKKKQPPVQQKSIFDQLREWNIKQELNPALAISQIIPPTDFQPPDAGFLESVRLQGIIEPLVVYYAGPQRFKIAGGRRRWYAAVQAGLETVPAILVQANKEEAATLKILLNARRSENVLSDMAALKELIDGAEMTDDEVFQLTGLKPQTIKRLRRLMLTDHRLIDILRQNRCSVGTAEAAAKLPPTQLAALLQKFEDEDPKRLTLDMIDEVRSVQRAAAVKALPNSLFMPISRPGTETLAQSAQPAADPHEWLHQFAGEMWSVLLAMADNQALGRSTAEKALSARRDAAALVAKIREKEGEAQRAA